MDKTECNVNRGHAQTQWSAHTRIPLTQINKLIQTRPHVRNPLCLQPAGNALASCGSRNKRALHCSSRPVFWSSRFLSISTGGDLGKYLKRRKGDLATKLLVQMCRDASAGLAYLEERKCIHRFVRWTPRDHPCAAFAFVKLRSKFFSCKTGNGNSCWLSSLRRCVFRVTYCCCVFLFSSNVCVFVGAVFRTLASQISKTYSLPIFFKFWMEPFLSDELATIRFK